MAPLLDEEEGLRRETVFFHRDLDAISRRIRVGLPDLEPESGELRPLGVRSGGQHHADRRARGALLLVAWVVFLRATVRSLGPIGLGLAVAIASVILWTIIYYDWIDPANSTALRWVLLTLLALILTAGMSWSHLRRRWSGQVDIDDVDDSGR